MATACVLFHRFFYAKSMVRIKFDEVAMAALGLACKIEECPRRTRDIINVFKHIKQVRSGRLVEKFMHMYHVNENGLFTEHVLFRCSVFCTQIR